VAALHRGPSADSWEPLPATEREAGLVFDMHRQALGEDRDRVLLQGADATEGRLKAELPGYSVAHLATHGYFDPDGLPSLLDAIREGGERRLGLDSSRPVSAALPGLLSGLVCAGANRPGGQDDDGYLSADEVSWLDLGGVELVVLSACDTGLGRARSGEGLVGLRRAFRAAGAHTVVCSLWSVQDEATAHLMEDFYRNLFTRGASRGEALRAAQLAAIARNRQVLGSAHPSTWGAFVLVGEW
jgi:CHAT domain-containing protein